MLPTIACWVRSHLLIEAGPRPAVGDQNRRRAVCNNLADLLRAARWPDESVVEGKELPSLPGASEAEASIWYGIAPGALQTGSHSPTTRPLPYYWITGSNVSIAQRACPHSCQSRCRCPMNCAPTGIDPMLINGTVMAGQPNEEVAALKAGSPVTKP